MGNGRDTIIAAFITHSPPDPIGSAKSIKERSGCSIYAGKYVRAWIEDIDQQYQERPIPNFYHLVGGPVSVDQQLTGGETMVPEPCITLKVINAPGHSSGAVAFYYQEEHILFTGDAIPEKGKLLISEDSALCMDTLKRMAKIRGVQLFCPAWDRLYTQEEGLSMMKNTIKALLHFRTCIERRMVENPSLDPGKLLELI